MQFYSLSRKSHSEKKSIRDLPSEIFRNCIFKYLSTEDVFNLGETCTMMKYMVIENLSHPLATFLQYLRTRTGYFFKEVSVYDEVLEFNFSTLCTQRNCMGRQFHKQKHLVVTDPLNCIPCFSIASPVNMIGKCLEHDILIQGMLSFTNCIDCVNADAYCLFCAIELDS